MRSINYYLAHPYKEGISKADVQACKAKRKPVNNLLNDKPTVILLVLTFPGRKLVRVNTLEKIKPVYWDFTSKSVKPSMHGSLELNDRLHYFRAEVTRQYRALLSKDARVSFSKIKDLVQNVICSNTPDFNRQSFIEYFLQFNSERTSFMSPLTVRKSKSVLTIIRGWMSFMRIDERNFFLEDIDVDFEQSFKDYLIRERSVVSNTIGKYFTCIKTFMRWARKRGFHDQVTFEYFKTPRPLKEVVWLNADEIKAMQDCSPTDDYMRRVQQCFLFMIFCGQRYSDVKNLKRRDLFISQGGDVDWHLYQLKGSKSKKIVIPLMPAAVAILDRLNFRSLAADDKVLPMGCNQWMNRAIKELCACAGINTMVTVVRIVGNQRTETSVPKYKLISCHTSRRSFVSLSIQHGMNTEYLGTITGHSSVKTMRLYLGFNQQTKRAELTKAWDQIV